MKKAKAKVKAKAKKIVGYDILLTDAFGNKYLWGMDVLSSKVEAQEEKRAYLTSEAEVVKVTIERI